MGFGSYDESEQSEQDGTDIDTEDAVTVHDSDHDGSIEFESEESTADLVDRLQDMKDD
ncbi:MAG: DUF5786 family protein [Halobacteriales archaeon]